MAEMAVLLYLIDKSDERIQNLKFWLKKKMNGTWGTSVHFHSIEKFRIFFDEFHV